MFRKLTPKLTFWLSFALILILAGTIAVQAQVWTDLPDYSPGSTVWIHGDNTNGARYVPDETVTVSVTGPNGYTAGCEAVVQADGTWKCSIVLWANDLAVGPYSYIAKTSHGEEIGTFTDANPAWVNFATTGLPNGTSITVKVDSYTNNGGQSGKSDSIVFTVPGPSTTNTSTSPSTTLTYTFPATLTVGSITYNLSGSSPASGFTTGASGSTTTVTGTYAPACTAPAITTQPAGSTKTVGETVTFSVAATGTTPLSYQWYKGTSAITGAASASYTINSVVVGNAGSYSVVVSNGCNPAATSNAASLTVNKATPVITWANPDAIVYGTALGSTQLNASANVAGSFTYDPAAGTVLGAGDHTLSVTLTPTDTANYNTNSATVSLHVDKATPVITWSDPADIVYGTALDRTQLSATASIAGTFVYTPAAGTMLGAGQHTLHVDFTPSDSNYNTASKDVTINVNQRPITVTADAQTKVYGETDPALTYKVTGSLVGSDAFSGDLTRDAGENVGSYAINQGSITLGGNYALTFKGAKLIITARPITVTADTQTKTYGDADPALTYKVTDGSLVGTDSYSGELARVTGENVGSYAINQGTLTLGSNYELTYSGANLTITARPVTVTADAQTKVYGYGDPALTYQVTDGSLVGSDAFSGYLTRAPGENVGSYAITQGTLALTDNYKLTYIGADLTISARPITVTADPQTKVYGNPDPKLTYKVTDGALAYSDAFSGELTRALGEDVGPYAINQGSLKLSSNYALKYIGANLTITARPITVTADAKAKTYGDADPALTYQITSGSLAFSDAFSGSLTRATGEDVGAYAINQGSLALTANYTLTYVDANLKITARPITITADAKTKVYGDADPALTYQVTSGSLAFNDAFFGALTRDAGENVGSHAITQGSLALSSNYVLTYVGANLTITTRPITVTADAQTKTYGDSDPALTYQITSGNLVNSDAFFGSLTRAAGENVGSYAITQGTLGLSSNYDLTFKGANLTITARPITVTADAKTKILGAADPALTYQITSGTVVNGDTFSGALTRATGENIGSYAITQGTLTLGSNYALTFISAKLTITFAPEGALCYGGLGHTVLQPVNYASPFSIFKKGSTVPVKFRVCGIDGISVGPTALYPTVVTSFKLYKIDTSIVSGILEDPIANQADSVFRWSDTDQLWIFNLSTKNLNAGYTYYYRITLIDGSTIEFKFTTK